MQDLPLHDIHLPAAVSWWPPAIGWWLLPIFLIALTFALYKLQLYIKHTKARANYKKLALKELNLLAEKYSQQENSIELLRAVSVLLRRIALSYLPRETVAGLTGEQWIIQLNNLTRPDNVNEANVDQVRVNDEQVNDEQVNEEPANQLTTDHVVTNKSVIKEVLFSKALTHLLTSATYQANVHYSQDELLNTCEQWIKQLPAQTSKQVIR